MGSTSIVEVDEDRESVEPFLVRSIRSAIGPFAQQGLDDSLGFAIRLRSAGANALVTSTQVLDDRAISAAVGIGKGVVGQDTLDPDAQPGELGRGGLKSTGGRGSRVIRHRDHHGVTAGVVDHDLYVVVSGLAPAALRSTAPAEGSPPATVRYPAELLVVLMDEGSGMAGDIADRSDSHPVGISEPIEAAADQDSMDGRWRPTEQRAESIRSVSDSRSCFEDLLFGRFGESSW